MIELPEQDDSKARFLRLVYNWLYDEKYNWWLVILDNPNDISFLFCPNADLDANGRASPTSIGKVPWVSFLPQTPNGRISVTSRNLLGAKTLVRMQHNIIRVEPMNEKDAMKFLQTRFLLVGPLNSRQELLYGLSNVFLLQLPKRLPILGCESQG